MREPSPLVIIFLTVFVDMLEVGILIFAGWLPLVTSYRAPEDR